ncbi:hypothetical protein TMEN_78 [Trichophyton mentagrophytes]|nr:hypothetical protein TMEN_78 [Trichophyton mentagrophytes]
MDTSKDSNDTELYRIFSKSQFERARTSIATGPDTKNTLKKLLSTQSGISTASFYAEFQNASAGQAKPFREIGRGSIGKIYVQPGTAWACKLPLIDRSDKLWNNYAMHVRGQNIFDQLGSIRGRVELPRVAHSPPDVLCMERVLPLPVPVRNAMIGAYCPPHNIENTRKDPKNKDYLVTVSNRWAKNGSPQPAAERVAIYPRHMFLGRNRFGISRPNDTAFFSLRNHELHLDPIRDLGLDVDELCESMAGIMAVLH